MTTIQFNSLWKNHIKYHDFVLSKDIKEEDEIKKFAKFIYDIFDNKIKDLKQRVKEDLERKNED